jgi:hypothetical protein
MFLLTKYLQPLPFSCCFSFPFPSQLFPLLMLSSSTWLNKHFFGPSCIPLSSNYHSHALFCIPVAPINLQSQTFLVISVLYLFTNSGLQLT